jgi:chromosome partitioning protein
MSGMGVRIDCGPMGGRYHNRKFQERGMPVVVVANPKGGVGKSTLSTNLAGALAHRGRTVMLGDVDRQQTSRRWLALRPGTLASIGSWDISPDGMARPPRGTTHVVLDTPAGLHGAALDRVLGIADFVIVPLQPSLFDIQATHDFIGELLAHRRRDRVKVGIVGMRLRLSACACGRTRSPPTSCGSSSARWTFPSSPVCGTRRTTSILPRADSRCGTSPGAASNATSSNGTTS